MIIASTQQRIWKAIRILKRDIDIPCLALTAQASPNATALYVRLLVRSGYMEVEHKGGGLVGNISKYRLIRNTGPLAPERAITVMNDRNSGETFELARPSRANRFKGNGRDPEFALRSAA